VYLDEDHGHQKKPVIMREMLWHVLRLLGEMPSVEFLHLELVNNGAECQGMVREFEQELLGLGFQVKHLSLSAADVGAPVKRNRFFLLARRRGPDLLPTLRVETRVQHQTGDIRMHPLWGARIRSSRPWVYAEQSQNVMQGLQGANPRVPIGLQPLELHRMAVHSRTVKRRSRQLGNAVVPLQQQRAFEILAGIRHGFTSTQACIVHAVWPLAATCIEVQLVDPECTVRWTFQADQANFIHPLGRQQRKRNQVALPKGSRPATHLPGPKGSANTAARILTARSIVDTSCYLRYEKCTLESDRGWDGTVRSVHPEYLEFMLGFPRGWTDVQEAEVLTQTQPLENELPDA
jgi:hypothetical protein